MITSAIRYPHSRCARARARRQPAFVSFHAAAVPTSGLRRRRVFDVSLKVCRFLAVPGRGERHRQIDCGPYFCRGRVAFHHGYI